MKDTFPMQREYFNNLEVIHSIAEIKIEWPYIFETDYLRQHFEELMGLKSDTFAENFLNTKEKIFLFFKKFIKNPVVDDSSERSILTGIAKYFNEDLGFLLLDFEFGLKVDSIVARVPTNTPFIAFVEDDATGGKVVAYILIEKTIVSKIENCNLLLNLQLVINFFFVLNIIYPREISQTLEFLVRFFYKHYPISTRGKKKNINSLQKVNSFISKITAFEQ
ncbi:PREDICTED: uncharacterized protein LOC108363110 [Rhagoletis zephyria]|uniref:uncharacterized protein LOC108363110 n=1 Tax=Rhagoletis zephyria TaxID=28612 RepID=UPI0008112555|nr:PREDICTED: uncharacterized protein LOC108363110 [Rhagoletis zephyria]